MQVTPIPSMLRETMSDFGMNAVDRWWAELAEDARADVIQLWRTTSFGEPCQVRVDARFVDEQDQNDDAELWHDDFYDYLINHEVYLLESYPRHVCTQHERARAAVSAGFIPRAFVCPLTHQDCPMRQLLHGSPGDAVILRINFTPNLAET